MEEGVDVDSLVVIIEPAFQSFSGVLNKGVDRHAFVQKLRNGRIDISALSVGSRYIWPTQWIVIAKHP